MFVTVIALIYALLVSQCSYGHFLKLTDLILFEQDAKSSLFNSTHHMVLYPQNGDRIVTIDSVTSLHPVYSRTAVHFSSSAVNTALDCRGCPGKEAVPAALLSVSLTSGPQVIERRLISLLTDR